jgi:hypothetical protein
MIYEIDPLRDPRWPALLRRHPRASVFHSRGWLEALYRTYEYKPAVLTTSGPNDNLANGLAFCRVHSWMTGRRLISLPFSDHCEPLVERTEDLLRLFSALEALAKVEDCKYVELRSSVEPVQIRSEWGYSQGFYLHRLDLRGGANVIFHHFHPSCIQRRIRHAEREGIYITEGRDPAILREFYALVLQTRRRQGLPPQPVAWFENLLECLNESALIRCAWHRGRPIAAILTMQFGKSLYYKYGASELRFHKFGAMPYLLWHAIREGIRQGLEELDMGRSDCENPGLIAFKERWSASRSLLCYLRSPADSPQRVSDSGWRGRIARTACACLPDRCLAAVGALSYPHID